MADGRVRLQGTLDLLVDSHRRDDRARALVVDFKTGMPRSDHDRAEVRFYALLTALATGRLPFRWATFYVTEGRPEAEDLHDAHLDATIRRVVDAVRQAARLAAVGRRAGGAAAPRWAVVPGVPAAATTATRPTAPEPRTRPRPDHRAP